MKHKVYKSICKNAISRELVELSLLAEIEKCNDEKIKEGLEIAYDIVQGSFSVIIGESKEEE